jgi:CMP-N-acetylneuraminic acid synthetase
MAKRFGDFYTIGMPGIGAGINQTIHVISDPYEMMKVLKSEGKFPSGAAQSAWGIRKIMQELGYQAAAAILDQGQEWKRVRTFFQTDLLSPKAAKQYVPAIAEAAKAAGAEVPFMRPAELANDTAGKWGVWQHALKACEAHYGEAIDLFVDLDCTSPLRDVADISKAIAQFRNADVDAVFSVCEARKNPYFNMLEVVDGNQRICKTLPKPIVRRQDAPKVFEHVASIYVLSPEYLRNGTGLLSGRTQGYDIGTAKSPDIDSEFDFEFVEYLMKKRLGLISNQTSS